MMTKWTTEIGLSDYKIRSVKIYRFTILALCAVLFSILLTELSIDLRATTPAILVPSLASLIVVLFVSYHKTSSTLSRWIFTSIVYLTIQSHFFYHPTSFHALVYWFPFVSLVALIISGIRVSMIWASITIFSLFIDSAWLQNELGGGYAVEISNTPILISGIIFSIAIMINSYLLYYLIGAAYEKAKEKSAQLIDIKEKVEYKKNLLESYMREFVKFSREDANFNHGRPHLFESICTTIATTLKVNRVSIWFFEDNDLSLVRECLYEEQKITDEIIRLSSKDYPDYFEALNSMPYILASDARTDPHTREFKDDYLKPLDIFSLLDCPIIIDHQPVGVICCENQNEIKRWNMEDALFVQSFADLIAMNHKNRKIELLVDELKTANKELTVKNKEIEIMNAALDTTVKQRTKALKSQNAQLSEYSFINSHLLRAPLSRILGLSQALEEEVTSLKEKHLIKALMESSQELDSIIRKINDVLYTGNGLTREDLITIERDIKQTRQMEQSSERLKMLRVRKSGT